MPTKSQPRITANVAVNDDAAEMLNLMFKRAEITPNDLLETAISRWVGSNLDILSVEERKKYTKKKVIFG
jgi:hypothetical protein